VLASPFPMAVRQPYPGVGYWDTAAEPNPFATPSFGSRFSQFAHGFVWIAVVVAALAGIAFVLYRNDVLLELSRDNGMETRYLRWEASVLGAPGWGTPRSVLPSATFASEAGAADAAEPSRPESAETSRLGEGTAAMLQAPSDQARSVEAPTRSADSGRAVSRSAEPARIAEPAASPRVIERTPPAREEAPRKSSGSGRSTRDVEIVSLDKLPVARKTERASVVEEIPVPDGPDEEEVAERSSSKKKARHAAEKEELVFKQAPLSKSEKAAQDREKREAREAASREAREAREAKAEAARAARAAAREEARAKAAPPPPPEDDNPLKAAIRASILKDSGGK
jgi:hypothetical protein